MKAMFRSVLAALSVALVPSAWALDVPGPVVDGAWVADHRAEITLLDVRNNAKSFTAMPEFETDAKTGKKFMVELGGHIAGATLVDNKKVRVTREIDGRKLSGMIPERADFEKLARTWGVQAGRPVVIVSAGLEPVDFNDAARLYWQFKVYGADNIAVLNGGTAGWIAEGREVVATATPVSTGNWVSPADRTAELNATLQDVQQAVASHSQIVDAREPAFYLGLTKPGSVSAFGHVPGAHDVPTTLMSTPGGDAARLMGVATYRDIFKMSGVDPQAPTVAYCNTGHQASGVWFVMHEVLGNHDVKLYDGSMHEWTMAKQPVESVAR